MYGYVYLTGERIINACISSLQSCDTILNSNHISLLSKLLYFFFFFVAAEEDPQIEMSCIVGFPAMFQMLN